MDVLVKGEKIMKVFRFVDPNIIYGERILLIASDTIEGAKKCLPVWLDVDYEHELIEGLEYHGAEGIIEHFYWEE